MAPPEPPALTALSPSDSANDRRRLLLSLTGAAAAAVAATAAAGALVYRRRRRLKQQHRAPRLQISILGDSLTDVVVSGIGALPNWGEDALAARPISLAAGGSALNTALQLGHLLRLFSSGVRLTPDVGVVLHTALGDDDFGRFLEAQVRRSPAVQLSAARTASTPTAAAAPAPANKGDGSSDKTGVCICLSGRHDRAFITHRGVVAAFSTAQLDRALLRRSALCHVAGYYNCPGLWPDLPALLAECRTGQHGAFTALSPQHDASGAWAGLETVFPHLDLFIPNEAEALAISGQRDVGAAAHFFVGKGVRNVIITLGAEGAYALVQDVSGSIRELRQPCPVKEVVDTTGAGDAFGAGVLYSLAGQLEDGGVKGRLDWEAALRWGCAVGAHAVTKVGASAPPTGRGEIEANLAATAR